MKRRLIDVPVRAALTDVDAVYDRIDETDAWRCQRRRDRRQWPAKLSSFSAAYDAHARFSWYDATGEAAVERAAVRSSAARAAIATGSGSRFGTR